MNADGDTVAEMPMPSFPNGHLEPCTARIKNSRHFNPKTTGGAGGQFDPPLFPRMNFGREKWILSEREIEIEREIERDRERQWERQRQRQRETERDRERQRESGC